MWVACVFPEQYSISKYHYALELLFTISWYFTSKIHIFIKKHIYGSSYQAYSLFKIINQNAHQWDITNHKKEWGFNWCCKVGEVENIIAYVKECRTKVCILKAYFSITSSIYLNSPRWEFNVVKFCLGPLRLWDILAHLSCLVMCLPHWSRIG